MDIEKIMAELDVIRDKVRFVDSCCDKPGDRMYRAENKTLWFREGTRWIQTDPPEGWVKKGI